MWPCRGVLGTCVSGCPPSVPGPVASTSDNLLHYLHCLHSLEDGGHLFCIKGLITSTAVSYALRKEFWKVKSSLSYYRVINKGKVLVI